jgi:hypothetical protein
VTHPPERDPTPKLPLPVWVRVSAVFVLGFIMPGLGRLLGRFVGDEAIGASVATGLFISIVVFTIGRREGSRIRAILEALAGGAVVGFLFWYFSR